MHNISGIPNFKLEQATSVDRLHISVLVDSCRNKTIIALLLHGEDQGYFEVRKNVNFGVTKVDFDLSQLIAPKDLNIKVNTYRFKYLSDVVLVHDPVADLIIRN